VLKFFDAFLIAIVPGIIEIGLELMDSALKIALAHGEYSGIRWGLVAVEDMIPADGFVIVQGDRLNFDGMFRVGEGSQCILGMVGFAPAPGLQCVGQDGRNRFNRLIVLVD